jgi:uncharacterized membrane protein
MSLPLTVRKNIRDTEPKIAEQLAKIRAATGREFTFVVDWNNLHANNGTGNIDSNCMADTALAYLESFAETIETLCNDELAKSVFDAKTGASKIELRLDANVTDYHRVFLEGGAIVLAVPPQYWWTNTNQVGDRLKEALDNAADAGELPLICRRDIRDVQPRFADALNKIKTATGGRAFTFGVDWQDIYRKSASNYDGNSIGSAAASYLENFADAVETLCADSMAQEAFNEKTPAARVDLVVRDGVDDYNKTTFENGAVVISVPPNYWWTNVNYAGRGMENLL